MEAAAVMDVLTLAAGRELEIRVKSERVECGVRCLEEGSFGTGFRDRLSQGSTIWVERVG